MTQPTWIEEYLDMQERKDDQRRQEERAALSQRIHADARALIQRQFETTMDRLTSKDVAYAMTHALQNLYDYAAAEVMAKLTAKAPPWMSFDERQEMVRKALDRPRRFRLLSAPGSSVSELGGLRVRISIPSFHYEFAVYP